LGGLAAQAGGGGESLESRAASSTAVIPAQAGIHASPRLSLSVVHRTRPWIPACAGMTVKVSSALATLRCMNDDRILRNAA